jgi:lipopolysaccharide biosynthesis regulator YciM
MKKLYIILLLTQSFMFASTYISENFYNQSLLAYKSWGKTKNPKTFYKALFTIDSAIDISPKTSKYWFFKGYLYMQVPSKSTLENAQSALMQAYILDNKNIQAQILLANNLFYQGKFAFAFNQYYHIINQSKKYHKAYIVHPMLLSLVAIGKSYTAKRVIDDLVRKNPHNTALKITQAIIYKMREEKKQAIKILKNIEKLPTFDDLYDYAKFLEEKWQKEAK